MKVGCEEGRMYRCAFVRAFRFARFPVQFLIFRIVAEAGWRRFSHAGLATVMPSA